MRLKSVEKCVLRSALRNAVLRSLRVVWISLGDDYGVIEICNPAELMNTLPLDCLEGGFAAHPENYICLLIEASGTNHSGHLFHMRIQSDCLKPALSSTFQNLVESSNSLLISSIVARRYLSGMISFLHCNGCRFDWSIVVIDVTVLDLILNPLAGKRSSIRHWPRGKR